MGFDKARARHAGIARPEDVNEIIQELSLIARVARVEVPKNGVSSKKVTKAMLNKSLNRPDYPQQIELPAPDLLTPPPGKFPTLGPDGRMPPRNPRGKRAAK